MINLTTLPFASVQQNKCMIPFQQSHTVLLLNCLVTSCAIFAIHKMNVLHEKQSYIQCYTVH